MTCYMMSGLRVVSDLALPGMIAHDSDIAPDVHIRRGPVPDRLEDASDFGPNWFLAGERFLLRVPGIVRLDLLSGHTLVWQTEGATTPADAAIFVCGSGFGLLMQQRNHCVLHASAVEVDGRAMLFSGPSGAGKSTLAAALVKAGYRLVSDDQVNLSVLGEEVPMVCPDGRAMRLWSAALDRLGLAGQQGAPVREGVAKFHIEPGRIVPRPVPVAGLYLLHEARATALAGGRAAITLRRLNLADAAMGVCANAFRPAMVQRLGQQHLYLRAAAAIERAGGVYHLTRPLDFAAMDDVVARLEAHWRDLREGRPAA